MPWWPAMALPSRTRTKWRFTPLPLPKFCCSTWHRHPGFVRRHRCFEQRASRAMITYPAYKVAAAHVAPLFLDIDRSVEKACSVIEEAAGKGARLIAFPE